MITGIERDLVNELGFVLVHDGQHNPGPFPNTSGAVRRFIKRYRKGDLEIVVGHDLREGKGDIVSLEWYHGKSREHFNQGVRSQRNPRKNSRPFFTLEAKDESQTIPSQNQG